MPNLEDGVKVIEKQLHRNWINPKANPALKTKREMNKIDKDDNDTKLLTERAAIDHICINLLAPSAPKFNIENPGSQVNYWAGGGGGEPPH